MHLNSTTTNHVWHFESRLQRLSKLNLIAQRNLGKLDAQHEAHKRLQAYQQLIQQLARKTSIVRKLSPDRQQAALIRSRRQLIIWDLLIQQFEILIEQNQKAE